MFLLLFETYTHYAMFKLFIVFRVLERHFLIFDCGLRTLSTDSLRIFPKDGALDLGAM